MAICFFNSKLVSESRWVATRLDQRRLTTKKERSLAAQMTRSGHALCKLRHCGLRRRCLLPRRAGEMAEMPRDCRFLGFAQIV